MSFSQWSLSRCLLGLAVFVASSVAMTSLGSAQIGSYPSYPSSPSGPGGGTSGPTSPSLPGNPSGPGDGGGGVVGEMMDVFVSFEAPPGQAEIDLIHRYGGEVKKVFKVVPAIWAEVPGPQIFNLILEPTVDVVEHNSMLEANNYANVWGVVRVGARNVHDGSFMTGGDRMRGENIRVAVFDTGIDYTHPELMAAYQGGYDFINDDNDPMDDQVNGHGTHVCGTVAAAQNGVGVVGVAPRCDLYAIKVLDDAGSGSFGALIAGLDWAIDNNIQVANMSLGGPVNPGVIVEQAFDNAEAFGMIVVCAAGNSGTADVTDDNVGYPAKYPSTIAVANTTIFNTRAGSSSTGPAVTVAAPGTGIFSTIPVVDGSYQFKTGTSMACPHVAGCIALMIQAGVSDVNRDGSFKDEILQVITETAIDLGPPGQDNIFGVGLIQVDKACKKIIDGISPPTGGPVFGKPTNLTASASGSTVTLRWNDNSNVETSYQIRFGSKVGSTITWRGSWEVASDTTSVRRTMPSGYWYFEVRAVQGVNLTDWSNTASVSVP